MYKIYKVGEELKASRKSREEIEKREGNEIIILEEGIKDINTVLKFAEEYNWSTHKEFAGLRDSIIIDKGSLGEIFDRPKKYTEFAKIVLEDKKYKSIDHLTFE